MRLLFCDLLAIRDKRICKACSCPVVPGNLNVFLQPKNKTNQQKQMGKKKKKSKQREKKKEGGKRENPRWLRTLQGHTGSTEA